MHRLALVCLLLTVVCASLTAQQPDSARRDTTHVVTLTPIEVVGTIQPWAGPQVNSGVPARITILSGAQVDAYEPHILSDVMAQQTGVTLYDDLGADKKLGISTRGFLASPVVGTPQGVSVFLDGVRQNEPDAAEVNFDLLPMQYISRVELISGTASIQGPNSLGGAINLVTVHGSGPAHGEIELDGGSWNTFGGNASISGGTPSGLSYFVGGGADRADGWRQVTGAHDYNGFFNVGKFTADWGLNFQGFGGESRAETAGSLPASIFDQRPDSNLSSGDYEDLDLFQGALSGYKVAGTGRLSFRTYYRYSKGERFNANQASDPDDLNRSRNNTFGWGVDYRYGHTLGTAVLGLRIGTDGTVNRTSLQLYADSAKFGGGLDQTTYIKSPLWDASGFITADLTLGRVTISGGARYDYTRVPYHDLLDPANDTTSSFSHVSPRGGLTVDAGGGLSVYASVGNAFRAPALIEAACADPNIPCSLPYNLGADPPIKPVTTTTYEAGATLSRDRVVATATVYRSDVRNDIWLLGTTNPATGSTINGYFANLAKTRREGVELGISAGFGKGHSVYVSYAYNHSTFQSTAQLSTPIDTLGEETVVPGDVIPLIPAHTVKFGADFQLPDNFELRGDGRYIGEQYLRGDEANTDRQLPSYFIADARVAWGHGPWEVIGLVTNVFNKHYAIFGTYNVNEGDPSNPIERFLTPGAERAFRLVVRRTFGGAGTQGQGDSD
ncbi:MAG TPA: TonB-dependent receptor [Gemmatimonadales bacterium]|nr:TonB-dependent receptor [Gemmatimonadales bacterium]